MNDACRKIGLQTIAQFVEAREALPMLHKAGITQRQLDAIVPEWNAIVDKAIGARDTAEAADMEKSTATLKSEWGAAYDDKLALAQGAITHLSNELKLGDSLTADLERTKLGNSPALAKVLAHIGAQMKEDGLIGKAGEGGTGALSPTEAQQQIKAMEMDKDKAAALIDRRHPKHDEVLAERTRLYGLAYPPSGGE